MNGRPWIAIVTTVAAGVGVVAGFLHSRTWGTAAALIAVAIVCGLLSLARDDLAEEGYSGAGVLTPRHNKMFAVASVIAAIGAAAVICMSSSTI